MPPDPNSKQIFTSMQEGLAPLEDPGYLDYLKMRAEADPADGERIHKIVNGLTHVALRGENGQAEYTDRSPALQARYWYRSLGPLNPMTDVEPDLVKAVQLMYGKETPKPEESANLQLDSAYALADLARVGTKLPTQMQALRLGLGAVQDIKDKPNFEAQDAKYRLQTEILQNDLMHDALRLRFTGSLDPLAADAMDTKAYRQFEGAFMTQEMESIDNFARLVGDGITEENFGILFEWYLIMAERFDSWKHETLETKVVRGATSRENAEWTGENERDATRVTGNHDVVVATRRPNGEIKHDLYQLKAVDTRRREYHNRVTIVDYQALFQSRYTSIDRATKRLMDNLAKFRGSYRDSQSAN